MLGAGGRGGRSARAVRRFPFRCCVSHLTAMREHETGVTSSGRLRVKAVHSRGDGNTRGTEPPRRGCGPPVNTISPASPARGEPRASRA